MLDRIAARRPAVPLAGAAGTLRSVGVRVLLAAVLSALAAAQAQPQPQRQPQPHAVPDVRASELDALVRASPSDVLVFFTSDDPNCGYCAQANVAAPTHIAAAASAHAQAPWRTVRVAWSPYASVPLALRELALKERLWGVPIFVMFRAGRELWRSEGWSPQSGQALEALLRRHGAGLAAAAPSPPVVVAPPVSAAPSAPSAVAPAGLALAPAESTLLVGTTGALKVDASDARGSRLPSIPGLVFESSDPGIVQVDASGRVTALSRGTATITARAGRIEARAVVRAEGFAQLSPLDGGNATCAIPDARDRVYCWGSAVPLPMGRGGPIERPTRLPQGDVPPGTGIAQVALAPSHGCLLTVAGSVHCFGRGRYLGTGVDASAPMPPTAIAPGDIPPGTPIARIAVGAVSACAASADGRLWCWGQSGGLPFGERGPGGIAALPTATQKGELPEGVALDALAVSVNQGCAVAAGQAYCWGGQDRAPRRLTGGAIGAGARMLDADVDSDLIGALGDDGRLYFRAHTGRGARLAQGSDAVVQARDPIVAAPGAVPAGTRLVRLSIGGNSAANCALADDGAAYCWGLNHQGATGTGAGDGRVVPAPARVAQGALPNGARWVDLACGEYHCAALSHEGLLYAWGYDQSRALGQGGTDARSSAAPLRVAAPSER